MSVHNRCINKQYAPKQFSYENKIFFSKTFMYSIAPTHPVPYFILLNTEHVYYHPYPIQAKINELLSKKKLYIVKFSQIFLSFHI